MSDTPTMVTATRKPFSEPPYSPDDFALLPDFRDSLTHYDLANGYTVSVLHAPSGGWEAWAWPTGYGHTRSLTPEPTYHDSEAEALAYRDDVGNVPRP